MLSKFDSGQHFHCDGKAFDFFWQFMCKSFPWPLAIASLIASAALIPIAALGSIATMGATAAAIASAALVAIGGYGSYWLL